MSLAHRLKLLIKSKEITQSQFARVIGITRGSVNQWLSGKLVPGHKPLMKIFEIYPDISADWLLLGKGGMLVGDRSSDPDNEFLKKQLSDQAEMMGFCPLAPSQFEPVVVLIPYLLINTKGYLILVKSYPTSNFTHVKIDKGFVVSPLKSILSFPQFI